MFFIFTRISYIRQSHMSHHNSCHILLVIWISLILRVDVIQTQSHRLKYSEALMRLEPPSTVPNCYPLYHLFASSLFSLRAVAYNVISFRSGKPRIYEDQSKDDTLTPPFCYQTSLQTSSLKQKGVVWRTLELYFATWIGCLHRDEQFGAVTVYLW